MSIQEQTPIEIIQLENIILQCAIKRESLKCLALAESLGLNEPG